MAAEAKTRTLVIAEPDLRVLAVTIKGITPLLCSNGEQAVEALGKRDAPNAGAVRATPEEQFQASLYPLGDEYGFPAAGIARALRDASARFVDKFSGKTVAGAVRIQSTGLLPIDGSAPRMDTAHVVHTKKSHDLAYRAAFDRWSIRVPLIHNAAVISDGQLLTLFRLAGFSVGIGAWRPECNGSFGMFEVEKVETGS